MMCCLRDLLCNQCRGHGRPDDDCFRPTEREHVHCERFIKETRTRVTTNWRREPVRCGGGGGHGGCGSHQGGGSHGGGHGGGGHGRQEHCDGE